MKQVLFVPADFGGLGLSTSISTIFYLAYLIGICLNQKVTRVTLQQVEDSRKVGNLKLRQFYLVVQQRKNINTAGCQHCVLLFLAD